MSMDQFAHSLVSVTDPGSFAAEQYQGLRLKIERFRYTRDVRVIAVSSPAVGDGKTVTSINLAAALARGSAFRVLLVDADLRRASIGRELAVPDADGPGLSDAVADGRIGLAEVTRRLEPFNLDVIPAGRPPAAVHDILRSPRLEELLQEARKYYEFVVLDTPPLIPVFDSALVARAVDGMLIVVAANRTPRKLLEEALNLLDAARVLGIVFNRDSRPAFAHSRAYYGGYFRGAAREGP